MENGLLNVAIKATKKFSLEVAKLYEHLKKRKFKIHSFRLALFCHAAL